MIEVTDEMVYAFAGEPEITATDAHAISVGLAAVLAIVERDYELLPYCNSELMPGVVCKLSQVIGHREHKGTTSTGNSVSWS